MAIFFPHAILTEDLEKMAKKIERAEGKYYQLQKNGDTIITTHKKAKLTSDIVYCAGCEILPTDVVEYCCRWGVVKWGQGKWLVYVVKGKLNAFYSFTTTGSVKVASSTTRTGETSFSDVATHSYEYYFESGNGGPVRIKNNIDYIRNSFIDNKECLNELNALVPEGESIKADHYMRLFKIMQRYNKQ